MHMYLVLSRAYPRTLLNNPNPTRFLHPILCAPPPRTNTHIKAKLVPTPREGEKGAEWWPHPPGFDNPYTRQMESQEVAASPEASQRDLDVDEEAGLAAAAGGGPVDSLRGFGGGNAGEGGDDEEDDEAWMVPSLEGVGHGRCVREG